MRTFDDFEIFINEFKLIYIWVKKCKINGREI